MSIWSNRFAPNLFKCYTDWYDNWTDTLHTEPDNREKDEARAYFNELYSKDRLIRRRIDYGRR